MNRCEHFFIFEKPPSLLPAVIYHRNFGQMTTKELRTGVLPTPGIFILILGASVIYTHSQAHILFPFLPNGYSEHNIMFGCVLFYLEMYHEYFIMLKILHFIDSVIISIVWLYHDLFPRSAFLFVVRYNKITSWWGILPIHRSNRCSKWERERNATGKLGWIRKTEVFRKAGY